jgi:hypothetical protein
MMAPAIFEVAAHVPKPPNSTAIPIKPMTTGRIADQFCVLLM